MVSAGEYGRLYTYNGAKLVPYGKIAGDYTATKCTVHTEAVAVFKGIPLFGVSQVSGNGVKYGIYSITRTSPQYPIVSALEYIGTHGKETDVEYGAIISIDDGFLVSRKDGTNYGLDKYDSTKKATGYIETRRIMLDRFSETSYGAVSVAYETLPSGSSIKIYVAKNGGSFTALETEVDATRSVVNTTKSVGDMVFGEVKIEIIPNDNNSPVIQSAILHVKN